MTRIYIHLGVVRNQEELVLSYKPNRSIGHRRYFKQHRQRVLDRGQE